MIVRILNHFRLTGRLLMDKRVKIWLKLALIALPAIYAVVPFAIDIPDFIPVVGLVDDLMLAIASTSTFNIVCPSEIVREHNLAIQGIAGETASCLEFYRHPDELRNLGLGLIITTVILLAAGMAAGFVWMLLFLAGYGFSSLQRSQLLGNAVQCSETQQPAL